MSRSSKKGPFIDPKLLKKNSTAQAGDILVLGKSLGVGIYSAALKKNKLPDDLYDRMIASTTQLNTPGERLACLPGVHALTDVTGFGLLGHALEICKGSDLQGQIRYADLNILPGVMDLAADGCITGASNRNWISYGDQVSIHDSLGELEKALLTDPQTSGGLLVACDPSAVDEVLRIFREEGFDFVTEIGSLVQRNHSPHYLTVLA